MMDFDIFLGRSRTTLIAGIIFMMDFDIFLDASRTTLIAGTLATLNLPIKAIFHQGGCVFPDVILVSNYHSYKKTIKLLPYHSFYGGHTPPHSQKKLSPLFWQSVSKNTKPP